MTKLIKTLPLIFFIGAGGLFTYQKLNIKTTVINWVGEYKTIGPNVIKQKYLLKQYGLKEAYFSSPKSRIIDLKVDFTFTSLQVAGNNDTIYYSGEWELIDGKPLLYFPNKEYYLNQLPLSEKIYYYEKVKTCGGDTINHFAVFKKIE